MSQEKSFERLLVLALLVLALTWLILFGVKRDLSKSENVIILQKPANSQSSTPPDATTAE